MNIQDLLDAGGFVSDTPEKREVIWKRTVDGEEVESKFDVFVRRQSFGQMEAIYGDGADRARMSKYISESIVDEKGKPIIPYEQAMKLHRDLGTLFIEAINDVNGLGKVAAKN